MSVNLEQFRASHGGLQVGRLLADLQTLRRMIDVSRGRRPALEVVGGRLAEMGVVLDDGAKRLVGKWVREEMEALGWTTDRRSTARVAPGNLFGRGAVYYPR